MKQFIISLIFVLAIVFGMKDFYVCAGNCAGNFFSQFDYKVFIIIFTISFMIVYKVVQYLFSLKIKESHSRIDIVFICFVVAFMILPISRIDHSEINKRENRTLAKYVPLIVDEKINFDYGNNFEKWFDDRFNQRDRFIDLNNYVNRRINGKAISDKAHIGKDGWLYSKQYNAVKMFQNDNLFSERELAKIKKNLENLESWLERRGGRLYILLIPDKETIYPEHYPENYGKVNDISRLQQVVNLLKTMDINFVCPYEEMMKRKKKELVYYKTGTHWNDTGANIGYNVLLSKIKKDFPELKILSEDELDIQYKKEGDIDIANALALDVDKEYTVEELTNKVIRPKYKNYKFKELDFKNRERGVMYDYISNDKSKNLKAFIYTDSFFNQIRDYAADSFAKMKVIFVGYGNDFLFSGENGRIVSDYEMDIMIISTSERFLHRLLHIKAPEEEK